MRNLFKRIFCNHNYKQVDYVNFSYLKQNKETPILNKPFIEVTEKSYVFFKCERCNKQKVKNCVTIKNWI